MATIVMSVDPEATVFIEQCRPVDIQTEVVALPAVQEMVCENVCARACVCDFL